LSLTAGGNTVTPFILIGVRNNEIRHVRAEVIMANARRVKSVAPSAGDRAAKNLRFCHELGGRVLARAGKGDGSVNAAAKAIASSDGTSFDQAKKAARFAKDFKKADLKTLRTLCLKPGNTPLAFSHIRRVLRVNGRAERMKWLRIAAQGGWSADQLDAEIGKSNDDGADSGGPRLRPPRDLSDALEKLRIHNRAWLKRYNEIWKHTQHWPPNLPLGETDAARLADRLEKEKARLHGLAVAATELSKRLAQVKKTLPKQDGLRGMSKGNSPDQKKRT
jgi:hypothetical protein